MKKYVVFLFAEKADKYASRLEVQAADLGAAIAKALSVASNVESVVALEAK